MNDERRLLLERAFDDEATGEEIDRLAATPHDPESLHHLRRLARLRELARAHDPSSAVPRIRPRPVGSGRRWRVALAAVAAITLAVAYVIRDTPRVPTNSFAPSSPREPFRPLAGATSVRPPLEVEIYRWANATPPRLDRAARAVAARSSRPGRTSSREVLLLELANAPSGSPPRLPRVGAITTRKPIPGPRSVPPGA